MRGYVCVRGQVRGSKVITHMHFVHAYSSSGSNLTACLLEGPTAIISSKAAGLGTRIGVSAAVSSFGLRVARLFQAL